MVDFWLMKRMTQCVRKEGRKEGRKGGIKRGREGGREGGTDLSLEFVGMMMKQSRPRISWRMRMNTSPSAKLGGEEVEGGRKGGRRKKVRNS